jgi:hypothetical protein
MIKTLRLLLLCAQLAPALRAEEPAFSSQLFTEGTLIYSDDFDDAFDQERWETRTKSWKVTDGALVGKPDYDNAEAAMAALNRDHHLGMSPVIRLNHLPEKFVLHLRVKFEGKDFATGRPKFDIGHYINTVVFNEKGYSVKLHGGESFTGKAPDLELKV